MKGTKVVVLESAKETSEELCSTLRGAGFDVCAQSDDGTEGLDLIARHQPQAAVVDLVLKGTDGFGVLDKLREMRWQGKVLVTGSFADDSIVSQVMSKGARYYMMRPVSPEVVAARLREACRGEEESRRQRALPSLDEKISNIFISIGIPPHIKGYGYLREGIKMAVAEPSILNNVTKQLYPRIAEKFGATASKVERAIRHSIEVAWNRQRTDAINAVFGVRVYLGTEKPTNSEFIALVADKLILENLANG